MVEGSFFCWQKKFLAEEKYDILKAYENGNKSVRQFLKEHEISAYSFYAWKEKYEKEGFQGLKKQSPKKYDKEIKLAAIEMYLSGDYSLRQVVKKYEISDQSLLRKWLSRYNSHRKINSTPKELDGSMTNGRKTTFEERIEIVKYCISNNKDYRETAKRYGVSYNQVYSWVKKYENNSEEGLKDKRGRKVAGSKENMSKEKQVELELRAAQEKIKRLEAENALLKKLEELEKG